MNPKHFDIKELTVVLCEWSIKYEAGNGNEAGKVISRGQLMKSLVCHVKKLRLYLLDNRGSLKDFRQEARGDRTGVAL